MPSNFPPSITMQFRQDCRIAGFTLIEMMVTLFVAILLAMVGIPQFMSTVQTHRAATEIASLYNDMQYARSEAFKEGLQISLCVSSNQSTCSGTSWSQGWIVFSNPTGAATFSSTTSTLLKTQAGFTSGDTVTTTPGSTTTINFNREGFMIGQTAGVLFTIRTATTNAGATRCMWISPVGNQLIQIANAALEIGRAHV